MNLKTLPQRGSVLITTLVFTTIMIVGVAAVLELSMGSYKLSQRNELRARARAVAESELENLYSRFAGEIVRGTNPGNVPSQLADIADAGTTPTTNRTAFTQAHQTQSDSWIVRRSIVTDMNSVQGWLPGGTSKWGKFSYYTAKVEVLPAVASTPTSVTLGAATAGMNQNIVTSALGGFTVRVGRHFSNSESSVFQYSIFFQGDLELAPGTNTTIDGDIAANGSIFMGGSSGHTITLASGKKINYLTGSYFNATPLYNPDGTVQTDGSGTVLTTPTYRKPGTWNASAGTVVPVTGDTTTLTPPVKPDSTVITSADTAVVKVMTEPENLLGGLDAPTIAADRNDLFGSTATTAQAAIAENNVFHAQISPPPAAAATDEYPVGVNSSTPDDPRVAAIRSYNRASLIITINTDNSVTFTEVSGAGTVSRSETTAPSGDFTGVVTVIPPSATTPMYDQREGKTLSVAEIDVAALTTQLAAHYPTLSSTSGFTGMLYVNVKNGSSSNPPAVRLKNADNTPNTTGLGFSVVTNGGLYVQGNFNSVDQTAPDGTTFTNPAMLMADSITVLSGNWSDANSSLSMSPNRVVPNGSANIQIHAGLLTGNVSATATAGSGGAQNLVRFLENWGTNTVTFTGSSGRLFNSTRFTAPFQTGAGAANIYSPPIRNYSFNTNLQKTPPPGSPAVSKFSRGNFFTW